MKRNSVQLTVSLPPNLYRKAMAAAKEESRSKSELVREALRRYLNRQPEMEDAARQSAPTFQDEDAHLRALRAHLDKLMAEENPRK